MLRLALLLSLVITSQSLSEEHQKEVGTCLTELVSESLTSSYNYLQLSTIFGAEQAYPGFASLYTKLSDGVSSKSHHLTKMVAMKRFPVDRLIRPSGIEVRETLKGKTSFSIRDGLKEARKENNKSWLQVRTCHETASNKSDAFVQDYLEEHHLAHHVEVNKLLVDLENRIDAASETEQPLIIYMIDEELLNTYGDRRKKVFS